MSSSDEEDEDTQDDEFSLRLIANVEHQMPAESQNQLTTTTERQIKAARTILRAWLMFKAAQEYAEKQSILRAEQEAVEASAPDAR